MSRKDSLHPRNAQMSRRNLLGLAGRTAVSVVVSQSLLSCASQDLTAAGTDTTDTSGSTTTPSTSCVLTAALTEGPYFVDEKLRSASG